MGNTLTVRLPKELAEWLDEAAQKSGSSRGAVIRLALENARKTSEKPFMRWAGVIEGPPDLSMRKGYSRK